MSAPFGIVLTNWSAIGAIAAIAAAAIGLTSLAIVLTDRFKARPKATIRELYVGWSERATAGCTGLVLNFDIVNDSEADDVLLDVYADAAGTHYQPFSWSSHRIPPCVLAPHVPLISTMGLSPNLTADPGHAVDVTITFELQRARQIVRTFTARCEHV